MASLRAELAEFMAFEIPVLALNATLEAIRLVLDPTLEAC